MEYDPELQDICFICGIQIGTACCEARGEKHPPSCGNAHVRAGLLKTGIIRTRT